VKRVLAALLALGALAWMLPAWTPARTEAAARAEVVALQAGTAHLVEGGQVLEGGVTIVVRDGKILAAGKDVAVPPGARVVDYGADAVIVPGLVAANSPYGVGPPSRRTADPGVLAVDNFDPFSSAYLADVAGGVTSAYLAPARGRLIAGQGAVVKLAGDDLRRRVVSRSAALQGSVGAEARDVPGYWDPPVPATVEVGLGVAEPQLPRTTMGAIVALTELLEAARSGKEADAYGPGAARELARVLGTGLPWRIDAGTETEIRAILRLAQSERLPLVIDGAERAGELADEIRRAGASAIVEVDVAPNSAGRDFGKGRDDRWPVFDTAARLVRAGVPIAIATEDSVRPRDLRFAAAVASRGGLAADAALRAITLGPAEILGVADRVGSIAPGKDADFAVLNGPPLSAASSVVATWIDGEPVWEVAGSDAPGSKAPRSKAIVIEVAELYVGDGEVLRPGQVLMQGGRIAEVGRRVAHPLGAVVVRGHAAMPGMIDAFGHLGLDGSSKAPPTDYKLARVVEPGDRVDRMVARAGVTTVVLTPRGASSSGTPMMAYKPAGHDLELMVLSDPTALHLAWTNTRNRVESGKDVREVLAKAVEYEKKWKEYEAAIAKWTPPPPEPPEPKAMDETVKEEKKSEAGTPPEKKDEKPKDKEKKAPEADPVTGIWEGNLALPPNESEASLRLRMRLEGKVVTGALRCAQVSEGLVPLAGTFEEGKLALAGLGSRGIVSLSGEPKEGKLEGKLAVGATEVELKLERTTKDLDEARRPELRREKKPEEKEPKGKPRAPGTDAKLEPLRRAMHGKGAVVVDVDRAVEILDCVKAFEEAGIKPVLYGADEAWKVADALRGRVAGVILTHQVLEVDPRKGLSELRNRFAELALAAVPVAFHSAAEEGASDLPLIAAYAVAQGMSPEGALRALTHDAAAMLAIASRVGRLAKGMDGDVLLLDGPPLEPSTSVLRTWVNGEEVR
jgi:imidazolonepropionase-like amidohydrolase